MAEKAKEAVEVVKKPVVLVPLFDLLDPFVPSQKNYLYFRLMGASVLEATTMAGVVKGAASGWRYENAQYKAAEALILENKAHYVTEAFSELPNRSAAKAYLVLDRILEMGFRFEGLGKEDKGAVMKAVDIALKGRKGRKEEEGSYDELVLKQRRKIDGAGVS